MFQQSELEALRQMRQRIQKIEQRLESLEVDSYERGRLVEALRTVDAALRSILVLAEVRLGLDALSRG